MYISPSSVCVYQNIYVKYIYLYSHGKIHKYVYHIIANGWLGEGVRRIERSLFIKTVFLKIKILYLFIILVCVLHIFQIKMVLETMKT